jgi:hypothetical protein
MRLAAQRQVQVSKSWAAPEKSLLHKIWGGARVVEWGRLLSGYRGEILGRRFESCPPRHKQKRVLDGAFLLSDAGPLTGDDIRILSSPLLPENTPKIFRGVFLIFI